MKNDFEFAKIIDNKLTKKLTIQQAFRNWQNQEVWLIVVPHDDDAIIGMGLTILVALQQKVDIHIRITTDGHMGYCSLKEKTKIAKIRAIETRESFRLLGVNLKQVKWLNFNDSHLNSQTGRYFVSKKTPSSIKGADGLQNAFTASLREVKPNRVFVPTIADLHPDHKLTNSELMISLFHASGTIWPELGSPTPVPEVVEFAVYCDYPTPPNIQLKVNQAIFQKKLDGILAYQSQTQIKSCVDSIKKNGSEEYLREIDFKFYNPKIYRSIF